MSRFIVISSDHNYLEFFDDYNEAFCYMEHMEAIDDHCDYFIYELKL